jgi:hypothetical protein
MTITLSDAFVSSIRIISDAPSCCVTYNCHSDNSRGVIYGFIMVIVQATGVDDVTLFSSSLVQWQNKLECLLKPVIYFQLRLGASKNVPFPFRLRPYMQLLYCPEKVF